MNVLWLSGAHALAKAGKATDAVKGEVMNTLKQHFSPEFVNRIGKSWYDVCFSITFAHHRLPLPQMKS